MAFILGLWRSYNSLLLTQPIKTKVVSAVTIGAAGDLTCQYLERRQRRKVVAAPGSNVSIEEAFDLKRTARFASWIALVTPIVHAWYGLLTRKFPLSPLYRMIADQTVFAPVGTAAMMVGVSFFEHIGDLPSARAEAERKLRGNYADVMVANYLTWPLFMWANFRFVPPQANVLAVNVASFFWSIFLSSRLKSTAGLAGAEDVTEQLEKEEGYEPEPIYGSGPSFSSHHHEHAHHQHPARASDVSIAATKRALLEAPDLEKGERVSARKSDGQNGGGISQRGELKQ